MNVITDVNGTANPTRRAAAHSNALGKEGYNMTINDRIALVHAEMEQVRREIAWHQDEFTAKERNGVKQISAAFVRLTPSERSHLMLQVAKFYSGLEQGTYSYRNQPARKSVRERIKGVMQRMTA
jgi:hypothetical protein